MPNNTEIKKIKTNFNISSKCPPSKWTLWSSFTNLSDTDGDGNDYETLDRHRSKFTKFIIKFITKFILRKFIRFLKLFHSVYVSTQPKSMLELLEQKMIGFTASLFLSIIQKVK